MLRVIVCFALAVGTSGGQYAEAPDPDVGAATFPTPAAGVVDLAGALSPDDETQIRVATSALRRDHDVEVTAVVLDSLAAQGAAHLGIDGYAAALFARWHLPDRAVLIVVSLEDRKVRIELGLGWSPSAHGDAARLVGEMVGYFRDGAVRDGILHAVGVVPSMRREAAAEPAPRPVIEPGGGVGIGVGGVVLVLIVLAVVILSVVSFAQHGTNGTAWLIWSVVFKVLFFFVVILSILAAFSGKSSGRRSGASTVGSLLSWGSRKSSSSSSSRVSSSLGSSSRGRSGGGATGSW